MPSSAIAAVASSAAAPPDMSIFMSGIEPAGLSEMPPVSKVTALPTTASVSPPRAGAGRRVAEHDHQRPLRRAGADRLEPAHAELGDRRRVEDLGLDVLVAGGDRPRPLGQVAGVGDVGRAGSAGRGRGWRPRPRRRRRARTRRACSSSTPCSSSRPGPLVGVGVGLALEPVEAVGGEDRGAGDRGGDRGLAGRDVPAEALDLVALRLAQRRGWRRRGPAPCRSSRARRARRPEPARGRPRGGARSAS